MWRNRIVITGIVALLVGMLGPATSGTASDGDTRVSAGSPAAPFSQNKQNEPALAVDANHTNILAAGSNDNIDMEACNAGDPTTCPFTDGIGGSGIYFSFDSGATWSQPTYSGLTARGCTGPAACTPVVGPIGTLPNYYENGLISDGDPALAFGPVPGSNGQFSWGNGSRLYYANLASNLGTKRDEAFKGFEAIAVSRTDDVASAAAGNNSAWKDPVIVSKQNSALFSDKEQIWADNAASSRFFGNVYICNAAFRGGPGRSQPLLVSTSRDGGDTWNVQKVTSSVNNTNGPKFGVSGCAIRTDSTGKVYVFAYNFSSGVPGNGTQILITSNDGGKSWSKEQPVIQATDLCNRVDPVIGRCVEDGQAGARDDLGSVPSVDIANGAPTGAGATNMIVNTWADGRDGLNNEKVKFIYSTDGGSHWTDPVNVQSAGDRGYYSAPAISPNGTDVYLVYNAFTTPYRENTTDPRDLRGVVLHADISDGVVGAFTEIHRGAAGDPRASSQNNLQAEFLGDYVYAVATRTYGAGVWNDMRNGVDCPAIDAWRASLETSSPLPRPEPQNVCPAGWGNSDIYGGSWADPTP
jgi:hypothetical protein